MLNRLPNPYLFFTETDGSALDAGYIYIGQEGTNPELTQIAVYSDYDMQSPIPQPIRTVAGKPAYNGNLINVFPSSSLISITVRNKNNELVFSDLYFSNNNAALKFRGSFDDDLTYNIGDIVTITSDDRDYYLISLENNNNDTPPSAKWITANFGGQENLESIEELINSPASSGAAYSVKSYHSGLNSGGGIFVWDSAVSKTLHNGGTIIDPDKTFPLDWDNNNQVVAWFTPSLSGSGAWIRVNETSLDAYDVSFFGAKGDGTTDDAPAINTTIRAAYPISKNVYAPSGEYRLISDRFDIRDTSVRDYNNITVFGDGESTHFVGESPNGRDLFQLNNVHNCHFRDFKITTTILSPTTQGSNGFSLTGDIENISIDNVFADGCQFTDNGTYLDGGKAFSIQTQTFRDIRISNSKANNCAYGFGWDGNGVTLAAMTPDELPKNISVCNNIFENCYRGIALGYSDTTTSTLVIPELAFSVNNNIMTNCQQNAVGRMTGLTFNNNKIRHTVETPPVYRASDTAIYGLACFGLFNSVGQGNDIFVEDGDYALGIGGTSATTASIRYSNNNIFTGNLISINTSSTGYAIYGINNGGNIVRNTIFDNTVIGGIDPALTNFGTTNIFQNIYEESTFTPILVDSSLTDEGATYSQRGGQYRRIGNFVDFDITLVMSGLGTLSGNLFIMGLPYMAASGTNNNCSCSIGVCTGLSAEAGTIVQGAVLQTQNYVRLYKTNASSTAGNTALQTTDITTNFTITVSGRYRIV